MLSQDETRMCFQKDVNLFTIDNDVVDLTVLPPAIWVLSGMKDQ
jgi:hypothetical protein